MSEIRQKNSLLPSIRCYEFESDLVRENAALCGMSVGAYMLSCTLKKKVISKVDKKFIAELSRLGGLQKKLFLDSNGANSKEYSQILTEIQKLILKIQDTI